MQDIITVFAANDVLWRFLPAYLLAVLSMGVVVSLAFLFSSLVENAIGPIIATMAVLIVFNILSVIEIDFFAALKPYLFTSYAQDWKPFFNAELDTAGIFKSAAVMLFHIVLFYSVTLFVFTKKDILS
jgi:ABC-2 type transport system permease protein